MWVGDVHSSSIHSPMKVYYALVPENQHQGKQTVPCAMVSSLAKKLDIQGEKMTTFNTQRTPLLEPRPSLAPISLAPIGTWARLPNAVPSSLLIGWLD